MGNKTIGFIGLGLIGGSIAKAIRRVHPDTSIIAYNRNKNSLVAGLNDGTLNQTVDSINSSFSECDIIFLCAPVSVNIACLEKLREIIKPECILTDVGSVKTSIHAAVKSLEMESNFIGGHPMAGSEKSGYNNANDRLLENAYYILTPSRKTKAHQLEMMKGLVKSIVSIPIILDYEEHDRITAAISHLPHIIAYTLVNLVKTSDNPEGMMRLLAAGGFKDITRIASSSPEMWLQICLENQEPLSHILGTYISDLESISQALKKKNAGYLSDSFASAQEYRNSIPKKFKGSIEPLYEIYVDIIDESGAIATIATILATNGLSIKNIGIIHNREFQEGALRIEFYDGESAEKSGVLLRRFHYMVYER